MGELPKPSEGRLRYLLGHDPGAKLVAFVDNELSEIESREISYLIDRLCRDEREEDNRRQLSRQMLMKQTPYFIRELREGRATGPLLSMLRDFEATAQFLKTAGQEQEPSDSLVRRLEAIMEEHDK